MYCPKCATQNTDDTQFCRGCGANVKLVPQAMTGRLPEAPSGRRRHRDRDKSANLADGITKIFMGIGFLLVSLAALLFAPAGKVWWFWILIPAFAMLGKGVADIVSVRYGPNLTGKTNQPAIPRAVNTGELPPHNEVLFPPPSVTEQTTRQLDPTRERYRYRDRDAQ